MLLSRRGFRFCGSFTNGLVLLVLCFQFALHIEIELSFALDPLLFHVSHDTLVHGGLLPFLLEVHEDDCAGGEEGRSS